MDSGSPLEYHESGRGDASITKFQTRSSVVGRKLTNGAPIPTVSRAHFRGSSFKLFVCAVGIFVSFFVYGFLQERITRGVYGENDHFHYTLTLVFLQCIVNAIFAKFVMDLSREARDSTPRSMYCCCSLSYLVAMLSSNLALQYVSYPTQVLGKSCKPIPVMVFGALFAQRRYPLRKYMFVMAIVVGVCLFFYENGKKDSQKQTELGFGEVLLLLSLFMDGVTGAVQDRMQSVYVMCPNSMMMWMNLFSSLIVLFAILYTGELALVMAFIIEYPFVMEHLLTFTMCSAVGQYFIFRTVAHFGSLPCSIITTTRKFFTILASVIFFNNSMSGLQWMATLLVFAGLIMDVKYGKDSSR